MFLGWQPYNDILPANTSRHSCVQKHRLSDDDVPFIKIEKKRGTQTGDGAPNRES